MEKICSHGHHNTATAIFCNTCGEDITAVVPTAALPSPMPRATPPPAPRKTFKETLKEKPWLMFLIGAIPAGVWFLISVGIGFALVAMTRDQTGQWIAFAITTFGSLVGAPLLGLLVGKALNTKKLILPIAVSTIVAILTICGSLVVNIGILGNVLGWPAIINIAVYLALKKYANS